MAQIPPSLCEAKGGLSNMQQGGSSAGDRHSVPTTALQIIPVEVF